MKLLLIGMTTLLSTSAMAQIGRTIDDPRDFEKINLGIYKNINQQLNEIQCQDQNGLHFERELFLEDIKFSGKDTEKNDEILKIAQTDQGDVAALIRENGYTKLNIYLCKSSNRPEVVKDIKVKTLPIRLSRSLNFKAKLNNGEKLKFKNLKFAFKQTTTQPVDVYQGKGKELKRNIFPPNDRENSSSN